MKTGAELIAEERQRQVEEEGWSPEHDKQWRNNELVFAAITYAIQEDEVPDEGLIAYWPWSKEWYKPKDRMSNLIRAGALIAAEIDRRQGEQNEHGNTR